MLTQEQRNFFNRWHAKSQAMSSTNVEQCIDKYVTLFINYNFLYSLLPEKIFLSTGNAIRNFKDSEGATKYVQSFVGEQIILDTVSEDFIADLSNSIPLFNIKFNSRGVHQPSDDKRLQNELGSATSQIKCNAVLEILYSVRCNIVHGKKGLEPYQMILLRPLISILEQINPLLYRTLNEFGF